MVALVLLTAAPGMSQEVAGLVSGTVTDPDGQALPGVTLTLIGDGFPAGTTAVTTQRGRYRFPSVPPGDYILTAQLDGFANVELEKFRVSIESALTADIEMTVASVAEAIVVTSEAPVISITASDTSATISNEWIDKMPVDRDFTGVITQAAGANDEDELLGGISIDGSSGAENRFIIDGIDTTDLQEGVAGKRLITDFIEEVQVKQGGYMAEFGGSTGGVINAVTKTGGNEIDGEAHLYWEDDSLYGDERLVLRDNPIESFGELVDIRDDDRERYEPGFTIGGPLVQDRLWFFAGYSPSFIDTTRTFNYQDGETASFNQEIENTYISANVSGSAGKFYYRVGGNVDMNFHNASLSSDDDIPRPEKYRDMPEKISFAGKVTRCEPPVLLAHTWEFEDEASEVCYELEAQGDKVLLTLTHRKLDSSETLLSVISGWHSHLNLLEDVLAERRRRPIYRMQSELEDEYGRKLGIG